jgi:hypothetical protein
MATPYIQVAFNCGELSPSYYGRVDLKKYREGCATLRNMFASYKGGATSRGGTAFVGMSRQPPGFLTPQLIPFQFNIDQGYMLIFSNQEMSVISNGAYITEDPFTVSAVTNANPGVFTATGNNFNTGDWIYLTGFSSMPSLQGGTFVISVIVPGSTFNLSSTLTGVPVDTTSFGAYSSGGTAGRVFILTTPYVSADLQLLKWTQSADVMTITHPNYPPMDLTRIAANKWTIANTTFSTSIAAPLACSVTASSTTSSNATSYQYMVTAVDKATGEESVASPIATITNSVDIGVTLGSEYVSWSSVTGASFYNVYKATPAVGGTVPSGAAFGLAGSAFGLSFVDTNVTQDFSQTPPKHLNPFAQSTINYFNITATGSGYTSIALPTVFISDPTGTGALGQAVVSGGGVSAIIVVNGGFNYTNPSVAIVSNGTGSGATFSALSNGHGLWQGGSSPANVHINTSGSGYSSSVTVIASYPLMGNPTTLAATSVTVGGGGGITAVTFPNLTAGNEPVFSSVVITALGNTGAGAAATAHVGPSTGTFPSCAAYFQDRRYYANTLNNPDTYFASQPGAFTNMDQSIPVEPSDAIVGSPWAQQVNGIQAMIPMPGGLVLFTGLGAWQLNGGSGGAPVTPENQIAAPQSYNGCNAHLRPIPINFDILFGQEKGSIIRGMNYNVFANIYASQDLTVLSNHLFTNHQIERWDWAEEPYKLVWAVRDDGILLSLTYLKLPTLYGTGSEADIFAWARHDTNGLFTSVGCVTELPVDAVYVVTRRFVPGTGMNGVYYIERMDNRTWTNIEDAWCLDCALSYPRQLPAATLGASASSGSMSITSYKLINGGTGYTAPLGQIIDLAGTGTGASVSLTVSGGVITSAVPFSIGAGYQLPQLSILDTTGSGAAIQPIVTNFVTFSASVSTFTSGNVGSIIRMGGGKAVITSLISPSQVIANLITPITTLIPNDPRAMPMPALSGSWSMTAPITTIYGLNHLEGMTVTALADGGVVEGLVVTKGSVTLPYPASAIVIGLPFMAQLQTMYFESQGGPTVQTRRKSIPQAVLRVEESRAPKIGVNQPDAAAQPNFANVPWTNMTQIEDRVPAVIAGQPVPLYSGDYPLTSIFGSWDTRGQIAVQQSDPLPLTVVALVELIEMGDSPTP